MINLDDLTQQWKTDSAIDITNITAETIRLAELHANYYHLYVTEGVRLRKLKSQRDKLLKDKINYYSGSMDIEEIRDLGWQPLPRMIMKADVQRYVDADNEVIELNLKIGYQNDIVDYIESILKQINNRGYNLRLIFDVRKFESGA